MKQLHNLYRTLAGIICMSVISFNTYAQDTAAATASVSLRYYVINNSAQYLLVQAKLKKGKLFQAMAGLPVQVYLDSTVEKNRLASTVTDEKGMAKIILPPSFKDQWMSSNKHTFTAVMKYPGAPEDITGSIDITRAKILLDTATTDGVRSLQAKVLTLQNNEWQPAADVEMKLGVIRSAGILSAGDELTYTTDSTGIVKADLTKLNLPGDQKGNFMVVAKVEDNELYGNLLFQEIVPWGKAVSRNEDFFSKRTLWSTQRRTPIWLLIMAYSIVIVVWSTIFYLVWQLVLIKRMA